MSQEQACPTSFFTDHVWMLEEIVKLSDMCKTRQAIEKHPEVAEW